MRRACRSGASAAAEAALRSAARCHPRGRAATSRVAVRWASANASDDAPSAAVGLLQVEADVAAGARVQDGHVARLMEQCLQSRQYAEVLRSAAALAKAGCDCLSADSAAGPASCHGAGPVAAAGTGTLPKFTGLAAAVAAKARVAGGGGAPRERLQRSVSEALAAAARVATATGARAGGHTGPPSSVRASGLFAVLGGTEAGRAEALSALLEGAEALCAPSAQTALGLAAADAATLLRALSFVEARHAACGEEGAARRASVATLRVCAALRSWEPPVNAFGMGCEEAAASAAQVAAGLVEVAARDGGHSHDWDSGLLCLQRLCGEADCSGALQEAGAMARDQLAVAAAEHAAASFVRAARAAQLLDDGARRAVLAAATGTPRSLRGEGALDGLPLPGAALAVLDPASDASGQEAAEQEAWRGALAGVRPPPADWEYVATVLGSPAWAAGAGPGDPALRGSVASIDLARARGGGGGAAGKQQALRGWLTGRETDADLAVLAMARGGLSPSAAELLEGLVAASRAGALDAVVRRQRQLSHAAAAAGETRSTSLEALLRAPTTAAEMEAAQAALACALDERSPATLSEEGPSARELLGLSPGLARDLVRHLLAQRDPAASVAAASLVRAMVAAPLRLFPSAAMMERLLRQLACDPTEAVAVLDAVLASGTGGTRQGRLWASPHGALIVAHLVRAGMLAEATDVVEMMTLAGGTLTPGAAVASALASGLARCEVAASDAADPEAKARASAVLLQIYHRMAATPRGCLPSAASAGAATQLAVARAKASGGLTAPWLLAAASHALRYVPMLSEALRSAGLAEARARAAESRLEDAEARLAKQAAEALAEPDSLRSERRAAEADRDARTAASAFRDAQREEEAAVAALGPLLEASGFGKELAPGFAGLDAVASGATDVALPVEEAPLPLLAPGTTAPGQWPADPSRRPMASGSGAGLASADPGRWQPLANMLATAALSMQAVPGAARAGLALGTVHAQLRAGVQPSGDTLRSVVAGIVRLPPEDWDPESLRSAFTQAAQRLGAAVEHGKAARGAASGFQAALEAHGEAAAAAFARAVLSTTWASPHSAAAGAAAALLEAGVPQQAARSSIEGILLAAERGQEPGQEALEDQPLLSPASDSLPPASEAALASLFQEMRRSGALAAAGLVSPMPALSAIVPGARFVDLRCCTRLQAHLACDAAVREAAVEAISAAGDDRDLHFVVGRTGAVAAAVEDWAAGSTPVLKFDNRSSRTLMLRAQSLKAWGQAALGGDSLAGRQRV